MIKAIVSDFSRTLLFPVDEKCDQGLNAYQAKVSLDPNYFFFDYFKFNEKLLAFFERIKEQFAMYIFTTGKIQETPEIKERLALIFKKIYTVDSVGFRKDDQRAYLYIAQDLELGPSDILYIDDQVLNVNTAKDAGLKSLQFQEDKEFYQQLNKLWNL
ncbi:MAG: HAD-IA family hydrolase [Patescibacteria group bacterium]|nr:HAD-IA family hydrolase [Patescibacteria group bacterium]